MYSSDRRRIGNARRFIQYFQNRAKHVRRRFLRVEDVNDIDRWSRLCFPILFIIFNASYWPYYIVRPQTFPWNKRKKRKGRETIDVIRLIDENWLTSLVFSPGSEKWLSSTFSVSSQIITTKNTDEARSYLHVHSSDSIRFFIEQFVSIRKIFFSFIIGQWTIFDLSKINSLFLSFNQ